jgi:hypothetical protein
MSDYEAPLLTFLVASFPHLLCAPRGAGDMRPEVNEAVLDNPSPHTALISEILPAILSSWLRSRQPQRPGNCHNWGTHDAEVAARDTVGTAQAGSSSRPDGCAYDHAVPWTASFSVALPRYKYSFPNDHSNSRRTASLGSPSSRWHVHPSSFKLAPQPGHRPRQSALHKGAKGAARDKFWRVTSVRSRM